VIRFFVATKVYPHSVGPCLIEICEELTNPSFSLVKELIFVKAYRKYKQTRSQRKFVNKTRNLFSFRYFPDLFSKLLLDNIRDKT